MAKENIFQEIPAGKQRETEIHAACFQPKEVVLRKEFTKDELEEFTRQSLENQIQIRKKMEEVKKLKDELFAFCRPLLKDNEYYMACVRYGYVNVPKQAYVFHSEDGMLDHYDCDGIYLFSIKNEAQNENNNN
jgi:hypothetical protein